MITVLYNTDTNLIISNFREGHYLVDGAPGKLDSNIIELEIEFTNRPIITSTEKIIESWGRIGDKYVQNYTVINKTDEELEADRISAIPDEISKRQLKIALLVQLGIETEHINNMISQMSDDTQRKITEIEWNDSAFVKRSHPMVNEFWKQLGYTDRQLDDLFTFAKDL